MTTSNARLTSALALTAAALSFAAAVIRYAGTGEIRWSLLAAGLFLVAMGVGVRRRKA
jgi:hypothetical protein